MKIRPANHRPRQVWPWLLLLLGLLALPLQAEVRPLDRIAIIVNNDVIMKSQLDQRIREVRNTIQKRGAEMPPEDVLLQQVMERLIVESLQLQLADRAGVRISDEELNEAIGNIAQRNGLTELQFMNALAQDGLDTRAAREQIRREMLISRVRQGVVNERIQISDQEIRNFMASDLGKIQMSEEYHLANILIPVQEAASAADIQKAGQLAMSLYEQTRHGVDFGRLAVAHSASENALEGGDMGWRKAIQLPPPFDELVQHLPVGGVTEPVRTPPGFIMIKLLEKHGGERQIRDEVHVRHILVKPSEVRTEQEARQMIQKLYDRIMAGESFTELAGAYSEDPGSALNGGDLNWIDPEVLVPEFRRMMQNTPSGELSVPFRSQYGWHILQVLGRRATDSSEDIRRQQAMNILRGRRFDEELQSWLRQIRDEAYVDIKL